MKKIKVAQFGLGPIGIESLKLAATIPSLEIIGGVDVDPRKVGQSVGQLCDLEALGHAKVFGSLADLLAANLPDVILHTASSSAATSLAQMRPAFERGVSVASTCEELIFPALKSAAAAAEADRLCQQTGARAIGVGVNPGFVMDLLPIMLTGVSREVTSIYVERVVDASTRRQPLQAKIGSGQPLALFAEKLKLGQAGHAGLTQSLALVAHAMGWQLDAISETAEPVAAPARIVTRHFDVAAGATCGIHQRCVGIVSGEARIILDLQMYLNAPNPHDTVVIRGRPDLNLTSNGGIAGDDATVAALVNVIPRLLAARAGLRLLTELAAPCRFSAS